jgi:hypothetical protein
MKGVLKKRSLLAINLNLKLYNKNKGVKIMKYHVTQQIHNI